MTENEARANSNAILAAVMARRGAAGFSVRVTFSDRLEPFTQHCRDAGERDALIARAKRLLNVTGVEIVAV
jgi:hypothetical protein